MKTVKTLLLAAFLLLIGMVALQTSNARGAHSAGIVAIHLRRLSQRNNQSGRVGFAGIAFRLVICRHAHAVG